MQDIRKIIHIDMDAFFASVEQRDHLELRGKPVIVGGSPDTRGVVATCSYEARKFGIRSAMSSKLAYKRCPHAIFISPRIEVYKVVSKEIMSIFMNYTELVEPLSLDEAYLDVTNNKVGIQSAMQLAREIKRKIYEETQLTASAGVSFNKFLAKVASGYNKPNGLTVVTPQQAEQFIAQMPIGNFFGVGKVTEKKMHELGIHCGAELQQLTKEQLISLFKKKGEMLYKFAHGQDDRPVNPNRKRKSISKEITLSEDIDDCHQMAIILEDLSLKIESALREKRLKGKTVTLKIKFSDFKITTRRTSTKEGIHQAQDIMAYARNLLHRVDFASKKVRLLGICISALSQDHELNKTKNIQKFLPGINLY